jgi:hypothetical protein
VNEPAEPVRLYTSWRGLVLALASPAVLLVIAAFAISESGIHPLSLILLLIGGGLLAVSLFDYPIVTVIDGNGITRRTPLRSHRITWDRVTAVNRARGAKLAKRIGPLTAAIGKRRYLLVDRPEGADEYEKIRKLLTDNDVDCPLSADAPAADTAPTWLYHRKR